MDILEILGKIGFEWKVFLFNLVNFIIVALLLQKFFFKKVMGTIEARQQLIAQGVQNAEAAKSELAMSEQKGEEIIKAAKQEANEVVKQAVESANEAASKIKQANEAELEAMRAKAKEQQVKEREQMLADFKQEAADLVVLATEKLLQSRQVKADEAKQIINSLELNKEGRWVLLSNT